jgi:hypothetical protein
MPGFVREIAATMPTKRLLILSDIHYASEGERARPHFDWHSVANPLLRSCGRLYYHYVWLRNPHAHNDKLDRVIMEADSPDCVVANGDYSCDSAYIGVSDDVTFASAEECLGKLRGKFQGRFHATIGDHELGKLNLFGNQGGIRLHSWERSINGLNLAPFWKIELGAYVLMGVTSSVVAGPVFAMDMLPGERSEWQRLREEHMTEIRRAFVALKSAQKVLLFCHDPTALPFLWREEAVRARLGQIERTIIGHLHTKLVYWKSRMLAGMPQIHWAGSSVRRMSTALNEARHWRPFNVLFCPSLAGVQLLKDGGYYTATLDSEAKVPAQFQFHPLRW